MENTLFEITAVKDFFLCPLYLATCYCLTCTKSSHIPVPSTFQRSGIGIWSPNIKCISHSMVRVSEGATSHFVARFIPIILLIDFLGPSSWFSFFFGLWCCMPASLPHLSIDGTFSTLSYFMRWCRGCLCFKLNM